MLAGAPDVELDVEDERKKADDLQEFTGQVTIASCQAVTLCHFTWLPSAMVARLASIA